MPDPAPVFDGERLRGHADELERFNSAMVDRELRMIELKQQVNELSARLGQPPGYSLDSDEGTI